MTVTVFTVDGTHNIIDLMNQGADALVDNPLIGTILPPLLNSEYCTVQPISYPGALFPMATSIDSAVGQLNSGIAALGGDFILVGYSQGAGVISNVLKELQSGTMTGYMSQCLAGVTFGNICRQAGSIAPVQSDPGGHGIWGTNLITSTPDFWYDFAVPLDMATTLSNDTQYDVDLQTIFEFALMAGQGSGSITKFILSQLESLAAGGVNGVQIDANAIPSLVMLAASIANPGYVPPAGLPNLVAHGEYSYACPSGSTLTYAELAANYINEVAQAAS